MTCSFFGHTKIPKKLEPIFKSTLINLIREHNVNCFYIGGFGGLDFLFLKILSELKKEFRRFHYVVILSGEGEGAPFVSFPDRFGKKIPLKFATSNSNFIIEKADFIVTYFSYNCSALKILNEAELSSKNIINLGKIEVK